jgi:hypothetical protein
VPLQLCKEQVSLFLGDEVPIVATGAERTPDLLKAVTALDERSAR